MQTDSVRAKVVAFGGHEPAPFNGLIIGGRQIEVGQAHLLEPFAEVAAAVDKVASAADGAVCAAEEESVRAAYRALYGFFHALLPSAGHEVIDGVTYSVALLLVGEAIEAGRVVAASGCARTAAIGRSPANR